MEIEDVRRELVAHREDVYALLRRWSSEERRFLLHSDAVEALDDAPEPLARSRLAQLMRSAQEVSVAPPWTAFALRPSIARWRYLRICSEPLDAEEMSVSDYLRFKEQIVGDVPADPWTLEIDLGPFEREFPKLRESRSIGSGAVFLNRKLASELFADHDGGRERLVGFLSLHAYAGRQLMLAPRLRGMAELRPALEEALEIVSGLSSETPWAAFEDELQEEGFEAGWGADAAGVRRSLELLSEVLEAPEPAALEQLLARIPMIFDLAVISPHGWFGQSDVLGRPDTGGQVVYILDQVRALEKEMRRRLELQGLDMEGRILVVTRLIPEAEGTTCDQRLEPIVGTRNAHILRVPFRVDDGQVVRRWISRFSIWPYLERFAEEAETELLGELGRRPDLVIGNYSDGNLVAYLLCRKLGVTQCNIAHALEKTKYLLSDLYWKDNEEKYHFAAQYTADLISMNAADFIVTSSYQEIAGRAGVVGQYESYQTFTMPGLFRVVQGTDIFDPKFNIVSPGADAEIYYPYDETERRLGTLQGEIEALVLGDANGLPHRGRLEHPDRPIVFSMARLDRIKNLAGLTRWFAECEALRSRANLLLIAGHVDVAASGDEEERDQIRLMHELMDEQDLDGCVRWVGARLEKSLAGELYRWVADRRGLFVQPALFEAFGLTVVEAMASGLPVFATCYGGPLEIIEHGVSGFHVDPNHGADAAGAIAAFLESCEADPGRWTSVSGAALERVRARYTWERYAERIMTFARIYGFWRHVTDIGRAETRRYLEALYGLQLRPLVSAVPEAPLG